MVEAILRMAGVGYEIHYNMTTVDPPELVRFVIRQFEAVIYDRRWSSSNLRFDLGHPRLRRGQLCQRQSCLADGSFKYFAVNGGSRLLFPATAQSVTGKRCIHFTIPKLSMRQLIVHKQFPPTRLARYCCEALKESHGEGRVVVTGVRWDESAGRKRNQGTVTIFNGKAAQVAEQQGARYNNNRARGIIMNYDDAATRRVVEMCYRTHKTMLNPIIAEGWNPGGIPSFGQRPKPRTVESKIRAPRRQTRMCGSSSTPTTSRIANYTTPAVPAWVALAARWLGTPPNDGN